MTRLLTALGISVLLASSMPAESAAQTTKKQTSNKTASIKSVKIVNRRTSPTVTMDVRNASLHQALTRLFYASKVDFVFEGNMPSGLVTAKIQNQPFETALRLILDSSSTPLTYSRTGNVYMIRAASSRPVNRNVYVAENTAPQTYVETGWANPVPATPPPITVGFNTGLQPLSNNSPIQIGSPLGLPGGFLNSPGFYGGVGFYGGPMFVNTNPGGVYRWPTGGMTTGYGGSGFWFTNP